MYQLLWLVQLDGMFLKVKQANFEVMEKFVEICNQLCWFVHYTVYCSNIFPLKIEISDSLVPLEIKEQILENRMP